MLLSVILMLALGLATGDRNWPGFRGNGDSHTDARNLPLNWSDDKNVAWDVQLPGYGQSSPVVWRDRIFLTSVQGENKEALLVFSVDLKTGRTLWKNSYEASSVMKNTDTVSKAAPTPVVDKDRVYTFFESGDLFASNHSGNLIWQRKLATEYGKFQNGHGLGSSLAMTDDALVVLIADRGPSYMLSIDKKTGRNLWKVDMPQSASWATPVVTTHQRLSQILVSSSGRVAAYDATDGRMLWQVSGLKGNTLPSPSVSDGLAVIGSSDKGSNVAIQLGGEGDVTEKQIVWRAQTATANFASPLIHQGRVYFVNKVGVAFCLDLKTGEEIWSGRIGGECWASPLAAGDRIYFFRNDGVTVVVSAKSKLEILAQNTLHEGNRVYGVAAVDSALLIRSGRRLTRLSS